MLLSIFLGTATETSDEEDLTVSTEIANDESTTADEDILDGNLTFDPISYPFSTGLKPSGQ